MIPICYDRRSTAKFVENDCNIENFPPEKKSLYCKCVNNSLNTEYSCISCAKGKYKSNLQDEVCVSCPLNTTTFDQITFECNPQYTSIGNAPCIQCPANSFKNSYGSYVCKTCPAGYFHHAPYMNTNMVTECGNGQTKFACPMVTSTITAHAESTIRSSSHAFKPEHVIQIDLKLSRSIQYVIFENSAITDTKWVIGGQIRVG